MEAERGKSKMTLERTTLTRLYGFKIGKNILFKIGYKTIKYLRLALTQGYPFFTHRKPKYTGRKVRSKGEYRQTKRNQYRIFLLVLGWDVTRKYSKRHVYTWFHKRKYLKKRTFWERVLAELKHAWRNML